MSNLMGAAMARVFRSYAASYNLSLFALSLFAPSPFASSFFAPFPFALSLFALSFALSSLRSLWHFRLALYLFALFSFRTSTCAVLHRSFHRTLSLRPFLFPLLYLSPHRRPMALRIVQGATNTVQHVYDVIDAFNFDSRRSIE